MKDRPYVSARLAVNRGAVSLLTAPAFWPGRVYCRRWKFLPRTQPENLQQRHQQQQQQQQSEGQQQQQQQQSKGQPQSSLLAGNLVRSARRDVDTSTPLDQPPSEDNVLSLQLSPESDWGEKTSPAVPLTLRGKSRGY